MDDQEKILDLLRQQVQAEQEKAAELRRQNDLAEQSLKALQKSQQLEKQRNRLWLDISEQTAGLVHQVPELSLLLHGFSEKLEEYGEQLGEVQDRLNRIEYGLMLLLGGKSNGNKERVTEFIRDIQKDRLKSLLAEHYGLLHELEMKKVAYCTENNTMDVPAWMLREIAEARQEIAKLENDLKLLSSN